MSSSPIPSDLAGRAASGRKLVAIVYADVVGYSRLIELDDIGTLEQLRALRNDLIDPEIERHGGRIIQTAGDSLLIVFDSITEAVQCAVDVQREVPAHEADRPSDRRVHFRVGIDFGDIVADGTDLHGNGVIVAVRLQTVCPAGGVCVSRSVRDHVRDRLDLSFDELGELSLKNMSRPVEAFALRLDAGAPPLGRGQPQRQDISYCRTRDGVRLAWARAGQGSPLVKTANWMNHLEYDWESPIWQHVFRGLAREHTLIRYDARGNGMSDWDVDELSLDAWVNDLETVVDAAGVERFPLLGISQGCAISVAFAVRHPERVSRLVLYGGFAIGGKRRSPAEKDRREAMATLMRLGWGMDNPTFRQMFTGLFIPGATHEHADSFNELQRRTTSPECAARYFDVAGDIDIADLLAEVKAPTLVMHARGDLIAPFEQGRRLAAGIPGAHFVALQGQNHLFMEHEPASDRFFEEVKLFLGQ
jgi:class 3 adenylate cyclase/pimeloyl-ACP methyl ester carboxylesterase